MCLTMIPASACSHGHLSSSPKGMPLRILTALAMLAHTDKQGITLHISVPF